MTFAPLVGAAGIALLAEEMIQARAGLKRQWQADAPKAESVRRSQKILVHSLSTQTSFLTNSKELIMANKANELMAAKVKKVSPARAKANAALNRLRGLGKVNADVAIVVRFHIDRFRDLAAQARRKTVGAITLEKIGDTEIPQLLTDTSLILNARVWLAKGLRKAGYPVKVEGRKIILPKDDTTIDYDTLKKKSGKFDQQCDLGKITQYLFEEEVAGPAAAKKDAPKLTLAERLAKAKERYAAAYTTEKDRAALECLAFIAENIHDIEKIAVALRQIEIAPKPERVIESSVTSPAPVDFSDNKAVNGKAA